MDSVQEAALCGGRGADLRSVEVRLIGPGERTLWDRLMRQHHYLGFRGFVGESLRYVAEWQGQWVALLGWCAAALKCQVRDQWIGWPEVVQWRRLSLVANNARFLLLPGERVANLASRVLGLNLRRLSRDWQQVHGHPVWLAETFVDPQRFTGTCYRAAGWSEVGQTRGYGRRAGRYEVHGVPKTVWVRPLVRAAQQRLRAPGGGPVSEPVRAMRLNQERADELLRVLMRLPQCRQQRGIRHNQPSILAIAICAVLCGARSYVAMAEWAARCSQSLLRRLGCRHEPRSGRFTAPSEPTIRRVLQSIDAEQVDRALADWLRRLGGQSGPGAVAIDGKTLRGARRGDGGQVHLLGAVLHGTGVMLGQCAVGAKSNEIPAAPQLLASLELAGEVVTADALHTQHELARFLVEDKQADYCFTVKDNQPTLKQDIAQLFESVSFPPGARNAR
jgi:hypothetical protein